ncbi:shikimate kinase [Azohydromonas lata]|uniref:Shikimate kinase n=1 Tax=Azohydromonas lata TaxID=45677 RepID=A0ABU5IL81_9BURK|nr:shikimate kinase [Azohydromonas lata]MDZ5459664.1 shikimate kinase [Azohydromonas lata]
MTSFLLSLVGMPGAGKTTIGRRLARELGVPFHDSDHEIERRIGVPIREYFSRHGEQAFRDLEHAVITDLTQGVRGVLATGGGSVLREANRAALRGAGTVVYLHATPQSLHERLRHDLSRPLLQVADPLQRLHELFSQRDEHYRSSAHLVLDTGHGRIGRSVHELRSQLQRSYPFLRPAVPQELPKPFHGVHPRSARER